MPVRPASRSGRPAARKAAPAKTPVRATTQADLREYKTKEATPYHKAFAGYLVREVGLTFASPAEKKAFLMGIRLAITTRNIFNASDYIEEWREKTGEVKRGRKPASAQPAPAARKHRPEPEPEEEEDDEFEDEDVEDDTSDDDFDDDDSEDDDSEDDDDFDDDEEEPEPAPAPKRGRPATKAAPAAGKSRSASGVAPRQGTAKGTTARKAAPAGRKPAAQTADDDDFIF